MSTAIATELVYKLASMQSSHFPPPYPSNHLHGVSPLTRERDSPPAYREREVPGVSLARPGQEAAIQASAHQEVFGLHAVDVGVEPTSGGHFYPASPAVKRTYNTLWSVV